MNRSSPEGLHLHYGPLSPGGTVLWHDRAHGGLRVYSTAVPPPSPPGDWGLQGGRAQTVLQAIGRKAKLLLDLVVVVAVEYCDVEALQPSESRADHEVALQPRALDTDGRHRRQKELGTKHGQQKQGALNCPLVHIRLVRIAAPQLQVHDATHVDQEADIDQQRYHDGDVGDEMQLQGVPLAVTEPTLEVFK